MYYQSFNPDDFMIEGPDSRLRDSSPYQRYATGALDNDMCFGAEPNFYDFGASTGLESDPLV